MADTIAAKCPNCATGIKAPAHLAGKKVKCKNCATAFALPGEPVAAAPAAAKPAKAGAKPAAKPAPPPPPPIDDDDAPMTGYGVTATETAPRCPHCAKPMDPPDALICLHCGYNTKARSRAPRKVVVETTGGDYFMWLLPGFLAVLAIGVLIGIDIYVYNYAEDWVGKEGALAEYLGTGPFVLWTIVPSLFMIFFAGKFAIQRLILHPKPPEIEIR